MIPSVRTGGSSPPANHNGIAQKVHNRPSQEYLLRRSERRKRKATRRHGSTHGVWFVCSYGDVGVLRARKSQPVVYPSVRGGVWVRVGLWVSTRGLAIRIGGGRLVDCGGAAMADRCGAIPMNNYHWAFPSKFARSQHTVILNDE
jgi:hypothetical protein